MVPLALSGEDHGCRAPGLGHPAHRRIALRRHTRGRKRTTAWQLTLDHEHGALLGAVVEHFLGDDPRREVAERLRYHPVPGLLAPGDHAVAGDEVGSGLDRRIGCCGAGPPSITRRLGAAHLPLEVPHADTGLLQLADGALIARRVILPGRGERAQRLALERERSGRLLRERPDRVRTASRRPARRGRRVGVTPARPRRRWLEAVERQRSRSAPPRRPSRRSTSSQSTSSPGSPGRAMRISRRS